MARRAKIHCKDDKELEQARKEFLACKAVRTYENEDGSYLFVAYDTHRELLEAEHKR